jgi:hypothetical protein
MNIQELLKISLTLATMPPAEVRYVSEIPELAIQDIQIYEACRKVGNLKAWDELKAFRRKATKTNIS